MSCVVYALAVGLDKGPATSGDLCPLPGETTVSCRCYDEWFALAEQVRVVDGSDSTAVSRG